MDFELLIADSTTQCGRQTQASSGDRCAARPCEAVSPASEGLSAFLDFPAHEIPCRSCRHSTRGASSGLSQPAQSCACRPSEVVYKVTHSMDNYVSFE